MVFVPTGAMGGGQPVKDPKQAVNVSRVIVGAMMLAVAAFAVVAEFVLKGKATTSGLSPDLLLGIAGMLLLSGAAAGTFIPATIMARALEKAKGKEEKEVASLVAQAYLSGCVLRAAMLEGPGLFGAVAVLMTGNSLGLLVAGAALAIMLATFPSHDRLVRHVEKAMGRSVTVS